MNFFLYHSKLKSNKYFLGTRQVFIWELYLMNIDADKLLSNETKIKIK